jgi:Fe-S-cluster-containing dehydrogenase component
MKRILAQNDLCSGCRACEVECVATHEGCFGTATARIRVTKIEAFGVDVPHICRQCRRAPCLAACPVGALYRDGVTGAVLLYPDNCIGCAACVEACPLGVATLHPQTMLPLICDLCGGEPACVQRCVTGAIVWAAAESGSRAKREKLTAASAE